MRNEQQCKVKLQKLYLLASPCLKKIIMHTDHSTDAVQSDMHRTEEHVNRLINHCSECACIYMGMFLDMK